MYIGMSARHVRTPDEMRSWSGGRGAGPERAKVARRRAHRAPERVDEVRQVAEADVVRDVDDAPIGVEEQRGRAPQPRGDDVAMRRGADDRAKRAREMKRARVDARGQLAERVRLVRRRVDRVE